jgi:serine/threonine protein kinase
VRLLGRGGMGTVYLAEHILLGRQRALKFISSELSRDATFLRRFRREAQAAIELRHPNVVEVVDLDQAEDGSPYIAMEFVEGPDLRHALLQAAEFSRSRAEKLHPVKSTGFASAEMLAPVKGTGFSPYTNPTESTGDLQAAETPDSVKGTGFSPYINPAKSPRASAPEGAFPVARALAIARGIALG